MPDSVRVRLLISGMVQGVSFRYYTRREASQLGLRGWVRNLPTGEVEAVAEGDPDKIEEFVAWCGRGPPMARVDRVQTTRGEPRGEGAFRILDSPGLF